MKIPFPATLLRFSLLAALGTAGLLSTACTKDPETITNKDYSAIDDAIIQKYITDNGITTAQKQASGLYFVPVLTNASAPRAVNGNTAAVLYTGRLMDGTVFDASSQRGNTPFQFTIGAKRVIAAWDEGIALMHKGDKAVLLVPSALGYGSNGAGSSIPPNAVLRFEVELVELR